ncbi:MAG: orotate phosphoribosyltransferase [Actinomycetota bacterium]|nr:MAG: orotate [Actinomycetota bacterium]MDO8949689.1 orotate phosphoribosyltransferase [Actinomycetota bacterium]MDP3631471.1 orotate phosphoribosyltransferase [Actinomycetota bacterium]
MTALTEPEVLQALKDADAVLSGHFQLTSGRHSDTYVQCARILEDPTLTTRLAAAMVARLGERQFDLVAAPAVGGIIIGFAVAQALDVKFIFTERQGGAMVLRRGFEIPAGASVLVVEDVVTTGGSVAEVINLVVEAGGVPTVVTSIIDRGGPKAFELELVPLLQLQVESWEPESCGLCAADVPLYSPGSRRLSS